MEHNDIRHMLSEYLDDTVTVEEKAAIEDHLKTCRQCSDALNELRKTIEHIKTVEEIDPPAWMTQKVMAKVRAEAEKKSLFQRLFYPLSIKLPVQTVAVLFLAVTAFYIYKNIGPTQKLSEAPVEEFAPRKEAARIGAKTKGQNITRGPSARATQPPQTLGYKALDMKQEYEKPAPPVPEGQAGTPALAPAKLSEQPMTAEDDIALERHASPSMLQGQATGAATKAEKKAKSTATTQGDKTGPLIIVRVKNIEAAAREVEQAITQLGGKISKKENIENKKILAARINSQKLPDFKKKLKLIGEVKDEATVPVVQDSQVELRIELVAISARP